MRWFAGSVSTAIQVSRRNNALFIVFIETKNAKGEKMRELWSKIETSLFECPFVGVHLMEGDEPARQFSQIYPTPVLPASYIIDNSGKPIEIITLLKDIDYDEFYSILNSAAQLFAANRKTGTVSTNDSAQNFDDPQPPEAPSTSVQVSYGSPDLAVEERIERAKKLLEQKKKAEKEAKQLEEKELELVRINAGKLMQEAQKKREEQELIEAAAQRRREKIETEKERERLKAQIKADREEREFRDRLGKQTNAQASAGDMPLHQSSSIPKLEPVPSERCRVQVRLPDGDNIVDEFDSNEPLTTLIELIKQDGRVNGHFRIAQVYPRKVFCEEELQQSFLSLCLTPTCTLLVLQSHPKSSQIIAASPFGGIFSLISMLIIAPLQYMYGLVVVWFGWGSDSDPSTANHSQQTAQAKRQREARETGAMVRRRGNVTRLHNTNDDSDDDNANWNGNSTQFL